MKAFLSHSSKDKIFVNKVASKINTDECIIDSRSFIAGRLTVDEIKRLIKECDIFVFFISQNSLNNENVTFEIERYKKESITSEKIFLPIIIGEHVKYDDPKIPEWMRQYNLKRVFMPQKAWAYIDESIRTLTWSLYSSIKEKDQVFRGRNAYIEKFEQRYSARRLGKALCYSASGLESIGRSSFLNFCFKKVRKIRPEYSMPSFTLDESNSIEDFIFRLNELGVSIPIDPSCLIEKDLVTKVEIAKSQLTNFLENDEIVHIIDNGCLIMRNGHVATWFCEILNNIDLHRVGARLAVSSKYSCKDYTISGFWNIVIPELSPQEREWILEEYLDLFHVQLTDTEFNTCLNWLQGYPLQVILLAHSIYERGFRSVQANSRDIVLFSSKKTGSVLSKYLCDEKKMSFIATLAHYEFVKIDDILDAFNKDIFYVNLIEELLLLSICVTEGVANEYVRINDTVRDYVIRKRFGVCQDALLKMKENILRDFNSDKHGLPEASVLYSTMKEMISSKSNIDLKYLFPSHYAKCMQEIYDKRQNDSEVIRIAEILIEKKLFIDNSILKLAYYYLCLALARTKNSQVLRKVVLLDSADKYFIKGFYFRKVGRFIEAIDALNIALNEHPKHKRAQNELVISYVRIEDYEKALSLAEESYQSDESNIYFAFNYFKCLLSSYLISKDGNISDILQRIINNIVKPTDSRDISMHTCMRAEYEFFINNNIDGAYSLLNEHIEIYRNDIYAIFSKFNIAEKIHDIESMNNMQSEIKTRIANKEQYQNIIDKNDILILAHNGNFDKAAQKVARLSHQSSEKYKSSLLEAINKIKSKYD